MYFRQFIFLVAFLGSISVCGQQLDFRCLTALDGLTADGVFDLGEDPLGRLLIATEGGGLVRYDGLNFTHFGRSNSGLPDTLRCVLADPDGTVWIGSEKHGLWQLKNDSVRQVFTNALGTKEVRDLARMAEGLYVATLDYGLWLCSGSTCRQIENTPRHLRALAAVGDTLHIGSDDGLFHFSGGELRPSADSLLQQRILHLFVDTDSSLWAGCAQGAYHLNESGCTPFPSNAVQHERIRAIARDAHGDLWLGSRNGVYEFEPQSEMLHFYDQTNGLSNQRIRSLLHDRFGNLWLGTYFGGVCRLSGQAAVRFTRDQGFPESPVTDVAVFDDSTIVISTFDGELYKWHEGRPIELLYRSPSPDRIQTIEATGDSILFGTESGRLHILNREGFVSVRLTGTAVQATVIHGEHIFILTRDKLITPNRSLSTFDLACNALNDLLVVNDTLYLGSGCGLFAFALDASGRLETGRDRIDILPVSGTASYHITALTADRQGNLWMGTERNGVLKYTGSVEAISNRYLSDPQVLALTTDQLDNLWVATRNGLNYLEFDPSQRFVLSDEQFSEQDGLNGRVMPKSLFSDASGFIWVGTSRGLVRIDPKGDFYNPSPPTLQLTGLDVHFEPLEASLWSNVEALELPYNANHLGFHFRGVDLSASGTNYQCRLRGLEEAWVELGAAAQHYYPGLSPGNYQFELRAQNSSGLWNDPPLQYAVIIDQPFYSEWWFIIASLAGVALLIAGFFRVRLYRLKMRNQLLSAQVDERTKALQLEKAASERLLLNILPQETAEELKTNGFARSRRYNEASVLFTDLKGFTAMTEELSTDDLVALLDEVFKLFDRACDTYGVEKIKTIGDAYMCASGIPSQVHDHAERLVHYALHILQEVEELNRRNASAGFPAIEIRIGIHSGPLIAGVVGEKKFAYDVWGDTVNIAARMESSGEAGKVNISRATYVLVKDRFICTPRGKVAAKNKGELEMYFVENDRK